MAGSRWHLRFRGLAIGVAAGALAYVVQRGRQQRDAIAPRIHDLTRRALVSLGVPAESQFVMVNGVRLHTVVAGPPSGPLAVLLHGFPECWYSWRKQIPALVEAGYRVVAVDQRGYGLSDKFADVASYQPNALAGDVRELIRRMGCERAVVVGHDWGGTVAWRFAMDYPDRVDRLAILNGAHPAAYARELRRNPEQWRKSLYFIFFQVPWLPELLVGYSPRATMRFFLRGASTRKDAYTDDELEVMAAAFAQPGAPKATLNWYRASFQFAGAWRRTRPVERPVLIVWGEDDVALSRALTVDLEAWAPNLSVHTIPHCGHWVQNEAPAEVNAHLLGFLSTPG